MNFDKKLQKIVAYIKEGEKKPKDFSLGFELEHFVVDKKDFTSLSYYGEGGICQSLEELGELGFEKVYEKGRLLGLRNKDVDISIEPAGQLELALRSKKTVAELDEIYKRTMQRILPVFEKKNQALLSLGYHPKSRIDELRMIPKKRYDFMYKYFETYGKSLAHNMMKGTASMQVAIDFEDEGDFAKKYFLANALGPFFYTAFDNSPIFEGKIYPKRNLRQRIWENTDGQRCGIFDFSLDKDMTYQKYARKILETPMIFASNGNEDIYVGERTLAELMDDEKFVKVIDHALSIVFPDLRVKKYLEIRMPDQVPYPYNMAFLSLVKGIFYDRKNLDEIYQIFLSMDYKSVMDLKKAGESLGLMAKYQDKEIYRWLLMIIEKIQASLSRSEREFLVNLTELLERKTTLKDVFLDLYEESPQGAVDKFAVKKSWSCENGKD